MTDPYALLFVSSATGIVGIIGTLTIQWMNGSFYQHAIKASLEATNTELKKHIANMEAKDSASQVKILEQQAYIDKHLTRKSIQDKYTVDEPTGDLVLNEFHYCSQRTFASYGYFRETK